MRYTIIKGLDDNLSIDLGGSVEIICAVMKIGKALDALTFTACMNGAQLIEFLHGLQITDYDSDIEKDNRYEITAYDW